MPATGPETPTRNQVVAKVAALIVVVGATGIGLLTERQRRFEAAHAMTVAHRRANGLEREVREIRAEIADRLTPARIDARFDSTLDGGGDLRPILWSVGSADAPTGWEP